MDLSFDKAIELLEITDISAIKVDDIPQIEKKAKKRWHPDKVTHLNNPAITEEYTTNFQHVEAACAMIRSYLQGTYQAGNAFTYADKKQTAHEDPEDVIRKNAPDIQAALKNLWHFVKEKKYKLQLKEIVLSDGFKLKDLLNEDFKEDIAILSVVSFFYGLIFLGILTAIGAAISPVVGTIIAIIWLLQALSCVLGFAPLSRFWLPQSVLDIMIKFINFGLGIYNWAEAQGQRSSAFWVILLIRLPVWFAQLVKYIILLPLYELAKVFVGDKIVGVVKQSVNYYAEAAEWYVDELISMQPNQMTGEQLFHLSYLYTEFADVKSKF
jgi:hypothetical protein